MMAEMEFCRYFYLPAWAENVSVCTINLSKRTLVGLLFVRPVMMLLFNCRQLETHALNNNQHIEHNNHIK